MIIFIFNEALIFQRLDSKFLQMLSQPDERFYYVCPMYEKEFNVVLCDRKFGCDILASVGRMMSG